VVRLTQKLLKPTLEPDVTYPFCPLCLGIRDSINNLLEIGSTIKHIEVSKDAAPDGKPAFMTDSKDKPISVTSSKEWFPSPLEQTVCFGCKRMIISCKSKEL
jgi:metal-sulfur cluster biosynthetic enzyme